MNIIVFASALHDTQSVLEGRRKALEEYFAGKQLQMYSCSEVDGIGILRIAFLNDHGRGDQFREVVHGESSKDLLEDVIRLFCMEVDKTDRVFKLSERSFDAPAFCVEESEPAGRECVSGQIRNDRFK